MTVGAAKQTTTRLAAARRRALLAKRGLAVGSAIAFATALFLARTSHPGQASPSSADNGAAQTEEIESDDDFAFGTSSIAPSTGTPQVQSNVS